jgi:hypothetical protein
MTSLGFEVFNDVRSIAPDKKFWPEIEENIRGCDVFVVVVTRASMNSKWAQDEIAFADSLGKVIRPVWIEDCELPKRFADRDVIDFCPRHRVRDRKFAPSRILKHSPKILFGRENWLAALDAAWAKPTLNVYTLVAWAGVGKASLVAHWVSEHFAAKG